ncbi:pirin family protein [Legionella dresdenensis]|uniref:Pirin family protein n=1 Tax=Legionella dresdenensis TaxID=450200 RepID=A0ABV8CDH6_9GAMM
MKEIDVARIVDGMLVREGAGVKLKRYIGADRSNDWEPVLLFDYFDSEEPMDYLGGFPAHPHRGFETITYMLAGKMMHQDNQGHQGIIGPGDVQWMTAGRGVVHSEMPAQNHGRLAGIQLWLNLPADNKMVTPAYQEYTAEQLPIEQQDSGTTIKVIAGSTAQGTHSPISGIATAPLMFDIQMRLPSTITQSIPESHQAMVLVLDGVLSIQDNTIPAGNLAMLTTGDSLTFKALTSDTRCLLIAAKKLHEPIARLGPFVMNTQAEIMQAMDDFRNHRF